MTVQAADAVLFSVQIEAVLAELGFAETDRRDPFVCKLSGFGDQKLCFDIIKFRRLRTPEFYIFCREFEYGRLRDIFTEGSVLPGAVLADELTDDQDRKSVV